MTDLRSLPSVDALVGSLRTDAVPRSMVVAIARAAIAEARATMLTGGEADPQTLAQSAIDRMAALRIQQTINAAGVLLHTNLGRAPLHPDAVAAAAEATAGYSNIEFDLTAGERGKRGEYLHRLIAEVTGAEAAFVVNNNAGALFLALAALAGGRSVPVSRGELIEIGGSYRLPELMAASGTRLIEVGTTNRTRVGDYATVIDDTTAMLLKVHPSNYRVTGFSEDAGPAALHALAVERGVPFVYDIGSGLLDESVPWLGGAPPPWTVGEPGVRQTLAAGADAVTFSGDKLLGGPQAGVIAGSADLVAQLRASPIARAQRIDGATLAALTVTFEMYADGRGAQIPFWNMASRTDAELRERLTTIAEGAGIEPVLRASEAVPGAGSVPGMTMPSPVLVIDGATDRIWRMLLDARPAVVARRDAGELLIDVRAVDPGEDAYLADALRTACRS
jgi:L-seryl-tRNA(Ser) seleniumtransferase